MKLDTLRRFRKLVWVAVFVGLALAGAHAQASEVELGTVTEGDQMSGRGGIFDPLG
jgi:hypothetical protein